MSTVLNPEVANQLYTKVTTGISRLWAVNTVLGGIDGGEDVEASEFEVIAVEDSFGAATAIAENGTAAVVSKLGQRAYKVEGIKFSEVINFLESEILNILIAMKEGATSNQLKVAGQAFLNNAAHLRKRLFVRLEAMFWEGVTTGTMTVPHKGGSDIGILTGTTVLAALAAGAKWDVPATALPFADLKTMDEQFLETGMEPDSIIMNRITYNAFTECASVKAGLTEVETSQLNQGKLLTTIGDKRLVIYNGVYKNAQGDTDNVKFLVDGMVVMASLSNLDVSPVKRVNLLNLDASTDDILATTTGENFKSSVIGAKAGESTKVVLGESYKGILSFENPKAFVSQAMFS